MLKMPYFFKSSKVLVTNKNTNVVSFDLFKRSMLNKKIS